MLKTKAHRTIISITLLLVFGIGVYRFQKRELYPFASWAMYSRIRSTVTDFRLLVYEIDGMPVEPPAFLRDIPGHRAPTGSNLNLALLRTFGWAVMREKPEAAMLREAVERKFGLQKAEYALIQVIYDPLQFYREGTGRERLIQRYTSTPEQPAAEPPDASDTERSGA